MGKPSRDKGKRGEREFCRLLAGLGFDARRSQQFCGRGGTADVVTSISGTHWEVKRYARVAATRFLEQAERDAPSDDLPCVAVREDGGSWVVMLKADDLVEFARRIVDAHDASPTMSDSSPDSSERGRASPT